MRPFTLLVLLLQVTVVTAQPFSSMKDINTSKLFFNNNQPLSGIAELNGYIYYPAHSAGYGTELWRSNLSSGKSEIVKDIYPGETDGAGGSFVYNGFVYFVANDGLTGDELWKTDGTSDGTLLVKDIVPGSMSSFPTEFTIYKNLLFFTAAGGLWRSDGTENGTMLLKNINPGNTGNGPVMLTIMNDVLFFSADDGVHGRELWSSDGTSSGTYMVRDIFPGSDPYTGANHGAPFNFTVHNNVLYFAATTYEHGSELWRSDGTSYGTYLVKDLYPGRGPSLPLTVHSTFNNLLYFATAYDPTQGAALWVTDGTTAGTTLIRKFYTESSFSSITALQAFKGVLYMAVSPYFNVIDLWKTNGTAAGTEKWLPDNSFNGFTVDQSHMYFRNFESGSGAEPWVSDGTPEGTHLLKDIEPGTGSSSASGLRILNGQFYFQAQTSAFGIGIWKTDGTSDSTLNVVSYEHGTANAAIENIVAFDSKVYFSAYDSVHGQELWSSDGTAVGTKLVKDIVPGVNGSYPAELIVHENALYFVSNGLLWKTDGTEAGTNPVLFQGRPSRMDPMVSLGKWLYFVGGDQNQGLYSIVYRTDGTAVGTVPITSMMPSGYSGAQHLTVYDGTIYFSAYNNTIGGELWKIDTTNLTAVPVKDIRPGPEYSFPDGFTQFKGLLYFTCIDANGNINIWKTDGTGPGTTSLDFPSGSQVIRATILRATDSQLYLEVTDSTHGSELWKTDGTQSGTVIVKDITPGNNSTFMVHPVAMNEVQYLDLYDSTHGLELWRTNGTAAGTTIVKDTWPGPHGNAVGKVIHVYKPTVLNNKLLILSRNDGIYGEEPWVSDGTEAGTFMIQDISAGSGASAANKYVRSGNKIFFTAATEATGVELWAGNMDNILPKFRMTFTGSLKNHNALLMWETDNEYDVARFEVQRSKDGNLYESIGQDTAKGGINLHAIYNFTDENVNEQNAYILYYRIAVHSKSGEVTYSNIISLVIRSKVKYGPNPVRRELNIFLSLTESDNLTFVIYNQQGMMLIKREFNLNAGESTKIINVQNLPAGSYYLSIKGKDLSELIKFVKL